MIRRITGRVVDAGLSHIVVDVNGVGYLIHTINPGTNFARECEVTLWTHLAVRENALDLYGFTTRDELEVFELLLTLPKVGPKSAQQILAQADIALLKKAVAEQDPVYLSKMSGISKKTAEKIVLELKDKFADIGVSPADAEGVGSGTLGEHVSDIIDALVTLGYPQRDAREAVQKLSPETASTTEGVREALKLLSR